MHQHGHAARASALDDLEAVLFDLLWLGERQREVELAPFDLTVLQFYALRILASSEQWPTMSQLARHLRLTPRPMTGLATRLVKLGLVARADDPTDRRLVRIALTEAGRACLSEAETARRQRLAAALGHLPEADRRQLLRLLRAFTVALSIRRPGDEATM